MAAHTAKNELRKRVRSALQLISNDQVQLQSQEVARRLISLPVFQRSQSVSIFLSMAKEVSTASVIDACFASGKRVSVPATDRTGRMEMVQLVNHEDLARLPRNSWNIPEPSLEDQRPQALRDFGLDLVIVPGLYFDQSGNRLGYGKGYYDRYIKRCRLSSNLTVFVALALCEQLAPRGDIIPHDENDEIMDAILCANAELCVDNLGITN